MSVGDKGVCVRILEKEFRVVCLPEQEQALRDAAQYLDKQMKHIRQGGRVIGVERIAVMAALNIANELLTLKSKPPEESETFVQRLKVLQEKIDGVLAQDLKGVANANSDSLTNFEAPAELEAKAETNELEEEMLELA